MNTLRPPGEDLQWLREKWGGRSWSGITRIDDAKRAVDIGATAISVSNHGGNNLDGTPPRSACSAPSPTPSAGHRWAARRRNPPKQRRRQGRGARRQGCRDRPRLPWGLANGQTGVENVLDLLRMGLDGVLMGTGHKSVHELSRADLNVPEGFERSYGVAVTKPHRWPREIITMPASAVGFVTADPNQNVLQFWNGTV